jgi:hypothetical protein
MKVVKTDLRWKGGESYDYALVIDKREPNAWAKFRKAQDLCTVKYGINNGYLRNFNWDRGQNRNAWHLYFAAKLQAVLIEKEVNAS